MRELWWLFRGSIRVRLTGADLERTMRHLMGSVRLERIVRISPLTAEFTVSRSDREELEQLAARFGDRLEILSRSGVPEMVKNCFRYPVVCMTILLLVGASIWIPGRILFIRVEGNQQIPDRQILETLDACGLGFGANRSQVRSEQIKNRLLEAMPDLGWAGVNTEGCVATVSVRERKREPQEPTAAPGNIVAAADGIITSLTVTAGSPLCAEGDGVQTGQVLISGYTDLGLCTHVEAAEGEVYARTERSAEAVLPAQTAVSGDSEEIVKKYSIIIGKKRINFYSDSGILHIGCGKMTKMRVLSLPGGWTLPVALVEEQYEVSDRVPVRRTDEAAKDLLETVSREQVEQSMIAGEIQHAESVLEQADTVYRLRLLCRCHEMIGRRSSGILTEGDIHDGKNGERGTG